MSHIVKVALIATLLAGASMAPAFAGNHKTGQTGKPKTVGELISECMQEVEKGRTAGRKLSQQQRMVAEAQCRARAESEAAARNG